MAQYADFDDAFDRSQIKWGVGDGTESVRSNLRATNRAAHSTEAIVKTIADQTDAIGEDVFRAITGVLHAPEFAGWQEETREAAKTVAEVNAKLDRIIAHLGIA